MILLLLLLLLRAVFATAATNPLLKRSMGKGKVHEMVRGKPVDASDIIVRPTLSLLFYAI